MGLWFLTRGRVPETSCKVRRLGRVTTCWKKVSIASSKTIKITPRAAKGLPFVRKRRSTAPNGPLQFQHSDQSCTHAAILEPTHLDALSNVSKSHIALDLLNEFHLSWPSASEVGTIKAAEAILPRALVYVRRLPACAIGFSLRCAYIMMVTLIVSALMNQHKISKSHRLNAFSDELYSASLCLVRCVK